jgi:hypothetical protein
MLCFAHFPEKLSRPGVCVIAKIRMTVIGAFLHMRATFYWCTRTRLTFPPEDIPNSGTFTWTPSTKLEGDEDYAIEIIPAAGTPNYSPQFALDSNGSGLSSSTTSTTLTTSTTKTSTSAKPTETDDEEEDKTTTTKSQSSTKTTTTDASSKTDDANAEEEVDDAVPNESSATGISSSPLALVLCLAAAVAYLN